MMLADASFIQEPPIQVGIWLACAFFMMLIINEGFRFMRNLKGDAPQPPNAQIDERLTRVENSLDKLARDFAEDKKQNEIHMSERSKTIFLKIDTVQSEISERIDRSMSEANESRSRLHDRINPVVENTAEIKGRMDAFTQSFDNFTKIITAIAQQKKI